MTFPSELPSTTRYQQGARVYYLDTMEIGTIDQIGFWHRGGGEVVLYSVRWDENRNTRDDNPDWFMTGQLMPIVTDEQLQELLQPTTCPKCESSDTRKATVYWQCNTCDHEWLDDAMHEWINNVTGCLNVQHDKPHCAAALLPLNEWCEPCREFYNRKREERTP